MTAPMAGAEGEPRRKLAALSREERAALFDLLRRKKAASGSAPERIPRRLPDLDPIPASFAQERFWFLDRLQPGNPAFDIPAALRLLGETSPALLEAILGAVVRRHEALRTSFGERDGQPVQIIAPPGRWSLPLIDLGDLPEGARQAEMQRLADREAAHSFALERGPLLRATLVRLAAAEHGLLLVMHHIVSDGWSMGVLVREITALYAAALAGRPSPLPELAIQYADFAVWQRRWLAGSELDRQLSFWRQELAGVPESLDLTTDRPRPAVPTYRGARELFILGADLARELPRFARRHDATLFMVFLAAFQALLGRLSGQQDLAVGSPIANRTRAEIEPLIGFFVNTLVLRGDLTGDPSFAALLARVRQTTLDAYAHQDLPFELLVGELRPERHLSANPLFQVMCAMQNTPDESLDLPGLSFAPLELAITTAQFDLELNVAQAEGSLAAVLSYSAELFDAPTARRFAGYLETLLREVLAGAGRPAAELALLGDGERQQLLWEWNDTLRTGEPLGVVERFAAQAARTPDAVALEALEDRLTYAELDRRANRLAHRLRRLGVGPETTVGLFVDRSPDLVAGILAVWKAGGAYVPLDPGHPAARLAYLLEDSQVPVIALPGRLAAALPGIPEPRARLVLLDGGDLAEESDLAPEGAPRPGDLAYRIYTSGTTGRPKAVLVEHGNLASTLAAVQDTFGLGPGDRMPSIAASSFDIFLFELLGPLLAGGTVVLLPLRPTLDLERLLDELGAATLLHAVPAVMRRVVELARRRSASAPRLRALFTGGDAVPADLLADLRAAFPQARLWVLYGPTEATIACTCWPAPSAGPVRSLLGRPFPGAEIRLCAAGGRPVPIGVPGEIWIGGAGVARGYWRREKPTAEKFVELDGRRFFRSGDLARRLPDGTLEFLGRADQQVKVRGFRIEPGEIEASLLRHPAVHEAVAAVRAAPAGEKQLVAYVVPRPAASEAEEAAERIAQWRTLYDETYGRSTAPDPAFDTAGWSSSYTGQPIPGEQMREWVGCTVERVLALPHRRVLEVGCGTGLLLFRVAPHTESYLGTDFSRAALDGLRGRLGRELPQVELRQAVADDWSGVAAGACDLVIVNSVVQYFPGVDCLLRVLEGAVRATAPGGAVFVGDVRSRPLLEALHTAVELFQAPASRTVSELRRRVRRRVAEEEELVVDPAFFLALARRLPALRRVSLLLKRGRWHNELTRFRYDVVLHTGDAGSVPPSPAVDGSLEDIERLLGGSPEALAVAGLANARLASEAAALELLAGSGQEIETVEELRQAVAERAVAGVDPEALCELARRMGYDIALTVDPAAPFRFGAILRRQGCAAEMAAAAAPEVPALQWSALANDPLAGRRARSLIPELRRFLQAELPDYMVPSAFVLLDRLPLSVHGKVDRAALPEPETIRTEPGGATPPRTPAEAAMVALWKEVLGVDEVGLEDNFFELGGHSLLATQLMSRIRERLGVELPLHRIFETPTVAGLALLVKPERRRLADLGREERSALFEMLRRKADQKRKPAHRADPDAPPPLSFGQERLWFLDRLEPGNTSLNMPFSLHLRGALNTAALARALGEVAARHEVLRTSFREIGGRPSPVVAPPGAMSLPLIDLTGLAASAPVTRLLSGLVAGAPFDLAAGPVLRACLLRLAPELHVFLLTVHHIAADGWSMGVLTRELTALYAAFSAGSPSPLPPLPIQYGDFASWQREWLQGDVVAAQLAWWREALAGDPAPLDLPADHPRPAVQTYRGASVVHSLPAPLAAALRALSRREAASLFMTLLAGFQVLLGRLSGQDDVLVGSPIAGRRHAETEGLIGFFLNTLVLRADSSGNPSFRALLGRVRQNVLGAFTHQDIPFEALLADLQPARDLSRTPFFQVLFNMLNFPSAGVRLPGLEVTAGELPDGESKFDLTLYVAEDESGIYFRLVYNADLFDRPRMDELIAQYALLLDQIAAQPDVRIDDLSLVTAQARAVLPETALPLTAERIDTLVHERCAEHARRHPERTAVVDAGGAWSYGDLDAVSSRLARDLIRAGVTPGAVVAVWAHRSAALPAALLGVLRAGAAFLILDPAYPDAWLSTQAVRARPSAWVAIAAAGPPPAGVATVLAGLPRVTIDGLEPVAEAEAPLAATPPGGPAAPAYVVFTSGSTGEPKGIVGTHGPLAHFFAWHCRAFELGEGDRFSLLSGLAHDPLLRDVFTPLWAGGTLCIPAADDLTVPGRLAAWFVRSGITVTHLTPAMGRLLTADAPAPVPSLRRAFFGGDVLTRGDVESLRRLAPRALLVNYYGATETPQAMGWKVISDGGVPAQVPLGRGIDGVQLLVLGRSGHLAGIGEMGEIAIRTPWLARGYLDDPAATAERFGPDYGGGAEKRPHPRPLSHLPPTPPPGEGRQATAGASVFLPSPGDRAGGAGRGAGGEGRPATRAYRTGDLGRYQPDGDVIFAGRADAQVKIRGFRIETAAIESVLAAHPAVREAAVIARGEGVERVLAAFVVPAAGPALDLRELREHAAARLPEPMVPAAFHALEALPLTPNRKVDRRALARLSVEPAAGARGDERPRSAAEEVLAGIWAAVLRRDQVGVHDSFFELGGHSLLATQVASRIRDVFGVEVSLRSLFETPTVAGLAARLETLLRQSAGVAMPPLVPVPRDRELPLSFAQERLWFIDQLQPGNAAYAMPMAVRLSGPLSPPAVAGALTAVAARHEALRTSFPAHGGRARQEIALPAPVTLPLVDLGGLPEAAREAAAARLTAEEARRPFDLARGPLVRARLVRLAAAEHLLLLTLHHIVTDGWSMGILVTELAAGYRALTAGAAPALPALPVQYADYAVWQRSWLAGETLAAQLAYWRRQLSGAPPELALLFDRPRPAQETFRGERVPLRVPADLSTALEALGREAGATLFMVLLASFQMLLLRLTGQVDLTVGSPIAGRTRAELEGLIGFFVNTLVLRGDLSGDPPFHGLLERTRRTALEAYTHQDVPFEKLVEELAPQRRLTQNPLFQVVMGLQNAPAAEVEMTSGLVLRPVATSNGAARFDLTLLLAPIPGGGLSGTLEYKTDLLDPATVERWIGHWGTLLAEIASAPDRPLSELLVSTPAERDQLTLTLPTGEPRRRVAALSREERATLFGLLHQKKGQGEARKIERRGDAGGPLPLSFSQERLWFLDQLFPETSAYNIRGALRITGELDPAVLAAALDEIARRHAILRTVFGDVDGRPVQRIVPAGPQPLPVVDLAGLPDPPRVKETERLLRDEEMLPFDLRTGPVWRNRLLRLGRDEHLGLFTQHHIVSDGWSTGILVRETAALYAAFAAGRPSPLPELPVQYADYAEWQRERLQGARLEDGLAFWRRTLAGVSMLELPADRPRPAVRRGRGGTARSVLTGDWGKRLLELAQSLDKGTLYMALLAAFQTLLHRLTGQSDVAVGSPVANRLQAETGGLIGFFVNTLVLRGDLSGDPSFSELLQRVRKTALAAFEHQEIPFEKIVEALHPDRFLSHTPLFQVMFSLQNIPAETVALPGLVMQPIAPLGGTAKFDLTLSVTEAAHGLGLRLEYDRDLFDAATAERLVGHFKTLLAGAATAPGERLSALPLLTAEEREQIVVGWNQTAAPYPRESTVHAEFAAQAARTPQAVALAMSDTTADGDWTYADLAAAAGRLAHRLRRLGVGPEVAVAVLLERSPELVATLLGVLAAGGFFVPLDPAHPPERLAAQVARTGARVAVTLERWLPRLPDAIDVVCLDRDREAHAGEPAVLPAGLPAAPESLAYVMFTSGSTGEPKGVAVTHRNVLRLVRGSAFAPFAGEVWAQLAPASFDASTLEIWGPLLNGGTLAVFPPHPPSLTELADFVARHGVTSLWLTAGLFHQMVEGRLAGLAPLRRLLAGGDVLSPSHVRRVLAELPALTLVNGYGPTEGTTFTCCWEMRGPAAPGELETVPIGRPIANTRAHVLDAALQPVPVGAWGELCAGGDGLARGYVGRPDLTAERFVPDPFAGLGGEPGARLYRTGDLVRYRPDGRLEIRGRNDRQVKIRGFRIEPAEIETLLAGHPHVSAAAVLAVSAGADTSAAPPDRRLVAYVVSQPGAPLDVQELRAWLAGRLPEPMLPAQIVALGHLPLTPNGKVDRRELERIPLPGAGSEAGFVVPRDEVEARVAAIWRELLGVERVGAHDNFFALGGHSLLAARLMAAVRDAYGVEVPLRALFEKPTLAELALAITEARLGQAGGAAEDLLAELEGLSDEEAARRLADLDGGAA